MTLNEYQSLALRTAGEHSSNVDMLCNAALGLCGEAGEFADLYKKFAYQHKPFDREHYIRELGDILWYVSLASKALGTTMEHVGQENINKLKARCPDGYDPIRANNRVEGDI